MLEDVFYNISMNTGPESSKKCIENTENKINYSYKVNANRADILSKDHQSTCAAKVCYKIKTSLTKKFEFSLDRLGNKSKYFLFEIRIKAN
jgi:hypothetical protein